ncbi:MAG: hypothetical protein E7277_07410 [Lachnospiraceae bacterium]|jgi:hypothetical protein|nr:hypothetical protein [Lachnospiraceae bacterium]
MRKKVLALLLAATMMVGMHPFGGQMRTVHAEASVADGGNLVIDQPSNITVPANSGFSYCAFSFTTGNMKEYYGITVEKAESSKGMSPEWYVSTDPHNRDIAVAKGISMGSWLNLGSALGTDKKLAVNTTYYFCIETHASYDFQATVTVKRAMDNEGDTGALADYMVENVTKYGSLDNRYDVDVFRFEAKGAYTLSVDGEKKLEITVYSDEALTNKVYHSWWAVNDSPVDVSKYITAGSTYYVVVNYCGEESSDPKGTPIGYGILFKGTGSSNSDSSGGGTSSTGQKTTGSYLKKVLKSAYFVTNMGSKVSGKIESGKLTLKRGKDGFLCKKSKMKGGIFTKIVTMNKKSYRFKLAKGCKVVYSTNENGKSDKVMSKKWFNTQFKVKGNMYGARNIGVCLNKKNQVTLLYISTWDVGAEQNR